MNLRFALTQFTPLPPPNTLEDHLVNVAKSWAKGETVHIFQNLCAMVEMLQREREYYLKDHQSNLVNVDIIKCMDGLVLHAQDRIFPSARIEAFFLN